MDDRVTLKAAALSPKIEKMSVNLKEWAVEVASRMRKYIAESQKRLRKLIDVNAPQKYIENEKKPKSLKHSLLFEDASSMIKSFQKKNGTKATALDVLTEHLTNEEWIAEQKDVYLTDPAVVAEYLQNDLKGQIIYFLLDSDEELAQVHAGEDPGDADSDHDLVVLFDEVYKELCRLLNEKILQQKRDRKK